MMNFIIDIEGMHCGGCVAAVSKALASVDASASVSVDPDAGRATIVGAAADGQAFLQSVEAAGYDASLRFIAQS